MPVALGQCAIACQAAAGCDSFTYNPVQQGCFLKTAQCPNKNNCQVGGIENVDCTEALLLPPSAPILVFQALMPRTPLAWRPSLLFPVSHSNPSKPVAL